jgi:hypothetical protein
MADEALLLQNEVAKLRRPSRRPLEAYKRWFTHPTPALGGAAKKFLDQENDLIGLGAASLACCGDTGRS